MKILKWVLGTIVVLSLVVGVGIAALVYLVDWNDFKETIQNQTRKQTGRDLMIAGDLSPSVFPWAGISISDITLANAEGFGDEPFARIGSADVKVELLPLLRRVVNVRTVKLDGLSLDLQRAADGTTNWDDLVGSQATMTTTEDSETTTEVEGSSATIAALEVGGIDISDANVSWKDAQGGTDARLSGFSLKTGAIALQEPFDLSTSFEVISDSMDLNADVAGGGEVTIDLENQVYSLNGITLDTTATGSGLPGEKLSAELAADVMANLGEQKVSVKSLTLDAMDLKLDGQVDVSDLNTEPKVTGSLKSEEFSPREVMNSLAIAVPPTADEGVLKKASLDLAFNATPASAAISELAMKLDDTTLSGTVDVPSFDGAMPPLRFALELDKIDLDRYLPPPAEEGAEPAEDTPAEQAPESAGGDTPIELPKQMLRTLDVDGKFSVGSMKASNLTVSDIVIPVKAAGGKLGVQNLQAKLYEGNVDTTANLDASGKVAAYSLALVLAGVQADPLLADLAQGDSFLSGQGEFKADITTVGDSVNALTAGLNGGFDTAFSDGSINGINIGYQLRRAKAALSGQKLADDEKEVKTDFSSLSMSGKFTDGVMNSDDLDMRSPLLRVGGAGQVDLPGEQVDYTVRTKITGTAEGQGGSDLASLKGVELSVPVKGSFQELSSDPGGVLMRGMRNGISDNIRGVAGAQAKEAAAKAKAAAEERLKGQEDKLKEQLNQEAEKAKEKLEGFLK